MYWILLCFLVAGIFFPAVGLAALICMIGPVAMAARRGRYWCGHICPRGSFYDRIMARFSPRKPVPPVLRSNGLRVFMIGLIFAVFAVQAYGAGSDFAALGMVFLRIIIITTLVGIVLSLLYRPRAWCGICPMGTLSAWAAPRDKETATNAFSTILVSDACVQCGLCVKVCPMGLRPMDAKGASVGFSHGDCLKCGACIEKCPKKALRFY